MDETTKVELTNKQLGLLTLAVTAVMETVHRGIQEYDNAEGLEELFDLMEMHVNFGELWVQLQLAAGVPQSTISEFLAGTD
jgi:hypothetical protein